MVKKLLKNKIILTILVLTAAGLVSAAAYVKYGQPKTTDTGSVNPTQISTDPNAGKQTAEAPNKTDDAPVTSASAPEQAAAATSLTIVISRAGQIDQDIQIRAVVQGTKTGTCVAKLVGPNGSTIEATHAIEFQQTGYTCGSFNIPTSQFNTSGTWQLELTVSANGASSKPASQTITVTKP